MQVINGMALYALEQSHIDFSTNIIPTEVWLAETHNRYLLKLPKEKAINKFFYAR